MGTLTTYFGIVLTVFALCFLVSATIEVSFLNLEKILLRGRNNEFSYIDMSYFIIFFNLAEKKKIPTEASIKVDSPAIKEDGPSIKEESP